MQKALATLFIVCFLNLGILSAQSFTVSNDTVTGVSSSQVPEFVLKTYITNSLTNRPVSIKWERFNNNFDNGWLGNQICVYGNCYYYNVDTGTMVIQAGATESLDAHFGNDSMPGSGYMDVVFYIEGDSASSAKTTHFAATLTETVGISAPASSANDIQIYPNPAKDYVYIKRPDALTLGRIEIYNMLGLKVITQQFDQENPLNRIDLLDLQKGVYMIRIFDKGNNVVLTKSISKVR